MSAPKTVAELRDERARGLTEIDDILNTAKEAGRSVLDDAERLRHDELVKRDDEFVAEIARAETSEGDALRFQAQASRNAFIVPAGNEPKGHVRASRSLNELLYATAESVQGGTISDKGMFNPSRAVNPVDQPVVRNEDGRATQAPRIDEFRPEDRGAIRSFQSTVADMALFGMLVDRNARTSSEGFDAARSHKAYADRWQSVCRALDVDTSAEGGTWVPTGIGASMHEKVRAAGKVAPLFARVQMPTNPWKWPVEGADATAYRVAEPTGDTESKFTASTPGTVAATFDAEIFGARALFSRSLEADSALAILPFVRAKLIRAFVDAEERAVLDGDTDGTHQDSDVGATITGAVSAWDGLRKKGLAQTSQATTTTTAANLALVRKSMGKWGVNPSDLAFIVGVSSYLALLSDTNVLTVDKMGPQAVILNGQVGSLFGVPIIVSEHVRETLNASGVYDGITLTKTYALCVNRNEWAFGARESVDVEVDDSIYRETYQRVLVAFEREDFQSITDAATNEDTSIGYNITSGS